MMESREFCLPEELVAAARKVIEANRAAGLRIAVAESCTGGLVSAALTEIPGSSDVFEAGFVTYANAAKQDLLRVSPEVLDTFGAVSVAVAWAMAQGAIERPRPIPRSPSPALPDRRGAVTRSPSALSFSRARVAAHHRMKSWPIRKNSATLAEAAFVFRRRSARSNC
jgi:nicotinamide-nucleotide amidase